MRLSILFLLTVVAFSTFVPAEQFYNISIDYSNLLGQGNFGKVYKARSRATGKEYAVKILSPASQFAVQQTEEEIKVLKDLTSLRVKDITELKFYNSSFNKYYLGLDLFSGDLAKFIRKSSTDTIQRYSEFIAFRLIRTTKNLHEAGYGNFDIKPANVLVDNSITPYMSDFGLAMRARDGQIFPGGRGDMNYSPPEMGNGRGYSRKSDIWSLGITLIELFTGRNPFHSARTTFELENQIQRFSFSNTTPLPNLSRYSRINWSHVISNYMIQPESSRISAKDLYDKIASHLGHDPKPKFNMFLEEENEPVGFSSKADLHPLSQRFCITRKNRKFVEC